MPQRLNFTIVIYNDSLSKENFVHDAFAIVKERLSMFCNTVKGTLLLREDWRSFIPALGYDNGDVDENFAVQAQTEIVKQITTFSFPFPNKP